jgi:hypothetical protein
VSGIIGAIVAILLVAFLARSARKNARLRSNRHVLEYGRPVKIAGWFFLLLGGFFIYAAAHASADQALLAASVGGALFAGSVVVFLEFHLVRLELDEEAIHTFSPWRRKRVIPWSEVIGYDYSAINNWHILKTGRHGPVRLSVMLSGLSTMEEYVVRKTSLADGFHRSAP